MGALGPLLVGKGTGSAGRTQQRPLPKEPQGFVLRFLLSPETLHEIQGSYSASLSTQGLLSPWHYSETPPAPFRQPKGAGHFAPEQTNAVITNPRALTSAASLEPKAWAAEPACPSLGVRSWVPVSNSEQTSGNSRSPVSKCPSSPILARFPAGTN